MEGTRYKHFTIESLLGRGGMGEVYLAVDTTLERRVALKVLPRSLMGDPAAQGRLLDEARSCSRVQHPNIATIHSIEEDGGVFAIVMEYVEGKTLRDVIRRQQLSLHRVTRIGRAVAAGLLAAHEQGVVHRDLKPANVMLTNRGEVKIMDFGLALRPQRIVNTMGPNAYGTVGYMSPEQARGEKPTIASDIFSYGSLLYQLLTREAPFKGENDLATLQAIISIEPIPLRDLRRDTPPALENVVRRCMKKQVGDRYTSMREVAEELQYAEPVVDAGPKDLISELAGELKTPERPGSRRPLIDFRSGPGPIPRMGQEEPDDGLPPMAPLLNVPLSGAAESAARRDPKGPASTGPSSSSRDTSSLVDTVFAESGFIVREETPEPKPPEPVQHSGHSAPYTHITRPTQRPDRDLFLGISDREDPAPPTRTLETKRGRSHWKNLLGLLVGLLLAVLGLMGLLRAAGVTNWTPPIPGRPSEGNMGPLNPVEVRREPVAPAAPATADSTETSHDAPDSLANEPSLQPMSLTSPATNAAESDSTRPGS